MGRPVIPPGLWSVLWLLSTDGQGQIFPKWPALEEHTLMNIPKSFASNVLSPQQVIVTPYFPRRSSKNCSQIWPRFLWSLCFALEPSAHESLCVPFKNGGLCFPQSCGAPAHKPHWVSMPDAPRALSPSARAPFVELRTLTPVGESVRYSYFLVCGLPIQEEWGLLILCNRPSYLLMWSHVCLLE